jgi:hypothetical protein
MAADIPSRTLNISTKISQEESCDFRSRWRTRSNRGGNTRAKAAPLDAPARETSIPTLGTSVETRDVKQTRQTLTKTFGNKFADWE